MNIMEKRNNKVHENKYTRSRKNKLNINGVRAVCQLNCQFYKHGLPVGAPTSVILA
jgi:hypothetical protein